jgi:hypothetical protein
MATAGPSTRLELGLNRALRWLARHWLLLVYIGSVVLVGFQFGGRAIANNIKIFRWSFFHLVHGQDVYQAYPDLYYDVFKYSPTWAFLFAPFAVPPPAVGFFLWDLCGALLLYYAVQRLLPAREARLALALAFLEFLAAMQHASSTNTVVAALVILAFVALEDERQWLAALAIALGALMKIYPLVALSFVMFYPRKGRFAAIFAAVLALLVALPLLVTPPAALAAQWRSWGGVLTEDAPTRAWSVMQLLHLSLGIDWPNWPQQLVGTVIMLAPLAVRGDRWAEPHFRRLFLCSLMLYCLLFNHQVERPSFVVGFTGIAIWYAMSPRTWLRTSLMALALIGVPLLHSGIVPWGIRRELPLVWMVGPCLLVWLVIQLELLGGRGDAVAAAAPAS